MTDREFSYLATLGYTGSLADKRRAYYDDLIANGGEPDVPIVGEYVPDRTMWGSSVLATTSQRVHLTFFTAKVTETVTTVTAYTGGTAAGATPTTCVYGVYSVNQTTSALTLVAQTANDTSLFASTFTAYPKALSTSFSKVRGQRYAMALLVDTAAAAPTFIGSAIVQAAALYPRLADRPRLTGYLAGQTSLPASIADASLTGNNGRWAFYLNG